MGKEELKTEAEEYGIGSFVYKARTPFHPVRLINFLDKIFFLEMEDFAQAEDEEEDKDKKGDKENGKEKNGDEAVDETNPNYRLFGNASIEERDQKNEEQIKYMKENYGHIIRSKGFMWMAGRDEQYAEWSQAGTMGELTCGGPWVCLFPKDVLPEEGSEAWKAEQAEMEPGLIRDRRQEVVIIGSDLNKEAITKALDDCLLKEDENEDPAIGLLRRGRREKREERREKREER